MAYLLIQVLIYQIILLLLFWILVVRYFLGRVFLICGLLHQSWKLFASSYPNHCFAWLFNYLSLSIIYLFGWCLILILFYMFLYCEEDYKFMCKLSPGKRNPSFFHPFLYFWMILILILAYLHGLLTWQVGRTIGKRNSSPCHGYFWPCFFQVLTRQGKPRHFSHLAERKPHEIEKTRRATQ
jgi:hypothetical protein